LWLVVDSDRTRSAAAASHLGRLHCEVAVGQHQNVGRMRRGAIFALGRHQLRDPIETSGKPDAGRGGPTKLLGEAVIPTARRQRVLLAGRSTRVELENGARVVVEPAYQVGVVLVLDACGVEQPP